MAHEWITAATALRYLSDEIFSHHEQRAICERAHSGLIAARADLLIWGGEERRNSLIPKEFWWAEGHEALEQNWDAGDFSTWIDRKVEVKAFGVCFDFPAITELAPAGERAAGMQRISVSGDPEWLHSRDLVRLIYDKTASLRPGPMIVEAAKLGQLSARAMRASSIRESHAGYAKEQTWAAIEWDVPLWFWRDFTQANHSAQEWQLGKVKGIGRRNKASETIELQGVHFHTSGLAYLGLGDAETPEVASPNASNRGRKAKYDWPAAMLAIFGQIHRGDFKPDSQAAIEKALQAHLADGDKEPSESTVRPYAKQIWEESQKA